MRCTTVKRVMRRAFQVDYQNIKIGIQKNDYAGLIWDKASELDIDVGKNNGSHGRVFGS